MKRIYLAGPEVFLPDAEQIGDAKKKLCMAYGYEGIFPLDNVLELNEPSPQENGLVSTRLPIISARLRPVPIVSSTSCFKIKEIIQNQF